MKILFPLLAAFTLSACIEIDDSSNDELVSTLEQQNQILQQQLDNQTASINIIGEVYNTSSDNIETSYEIKVTVGGTTREPQLFTASTFEISDLPPNSDYSFVVSSTNDNFMEHVVYAVTPSATSTVSRSIGQISVAPAKTYSFSVKNSFDNSEVANLRFKASSYEVKNDANPLAFGQYFHQSSYDQTTGIYSITLPEGLHSDVIAIIDEVQSGIFLNQYNSQYRVSNSTLILQSESLDNLDELMLEPDSASEVIHQDITIRVSVFDDSGDIVPDLTLTVDDDILSTDSTFDATTAQYVLTGQFAKIVNNISNQEIIQNQIRVLIPAFTLGDRYYASSYFNIYAQDTSHFRVSTSGSQNYLSYSLPIDTEEFNLVIQPNFNSYFPSDIEVAFDFIKTLADNFEYNVFFSQPIEVSNTGYYLLKENDVTVVRGNESVDDLTLPGSTLVTVGDKTIETIATLSLNNTLLTFSSKSPLTEGEYTFRLNQVLSALENDTQHIVSVNNSKSFKINSESAFSIDDIILDNANYYNEGVKIKATNTAGDFDNRSQNSNYASLYFPRSINNLKTLSLYQRIVTKNGSSINDSNTFNVVSNGHVNISQIVALNVAYNENILIEGGYAPTVKGSSLPEGWVYRAGYSIDYLEDNTNLNKNSVTFDYAFETLDGVIETGQIELFVK